MSRFGPRQIPEATYKSPRPLHSALILGVHTGYARRRSLCARTLTAQREAIRPSSTRTDAAGMGRSRPWGDVERCHARAPDTPQIVATGSTAAREPHRQLGISKLLGHRAAQPTQGSRPDAKETSRSMLPGSGHDICPGERPRGGTRWPTAHRMSEHRTTHARALLTAC